MVFASTVVERWITKTLRVGPTGRNPRSQNSLTQRYSGLLGNSVCRQNGMCVRLATAYADTTECPLCYQNVAWYSLAVSTAWTSLDLTYILITYNLKFPNVPEHHKSYTNKITTIYYDFLFLKLWCIPHRYCFPPQKIISNHHFRIPTKNKFLSVHALQFQADGQMDTRTWRRKQLLFEILRKRLKGGGVLTLHGNFSATQQRAVMA
jgi:hypothetical protein